MNKWYVKHTKGWRILAGIILACFVVVAGLGVSVVVSVESSVAGIRGYDFARGDHSNWSPKVVGARPEGTTPWFLVVGDSISGGITAQSVISGDNHSWIIPLQAQMAKLGAKWTADVLACSGENTASYYTGCPMAMSNPLLNGKPQHEIALQDIREHGSSLKFIIVELGANDLFGFKSDTDPTKQLDALTLRIGAIVSELQKAAPGVPLLIADVYNPFAADKQSYATEIDYLNGLMANMAITTGATTIDFAKAIVPNDEVVSQKAMCKMVDCAHHDIHPTQAGAYALAKAGIDALYTASVIG